MSTYEKIASVLLAVLLVALAALWFGGGRPDGHRGSDFDDSVGQNVVIGPFDTVISQQTSGGPEQNCTMLTPVLVAALHDIDEHLSDQAHTLGVSGRWDNLEVNAPTLAALCNKNATITLRDNKGDTLVLVKAPFVRMVPQGGDQADIGTAVSLTASVTVLGGTPPAAPQADAFELVPDRLLETASSTVAM